MKKSNIGLLFFFVACWAITACTKSRNDDNGLIYGITNIYMPQSINVSAGINTNYPVPSGTDSSTYNYWLDTVNKKLNVILGVARSGMQASEAFTVNVVASTDTVKKLVASGVLDTTTIAMPTAMYQLATTASVAAGQTSATFNLTVDIAQLKQSTYAGKKLALAVSITNPTKFTINTAQATTIVVLDVNALVIGPKADITGTYLLNTGLPFVASSMDAGGRWGTLSIWKANTAAKSHNGNGGFASDDGGTMDMESGWGSPAIYNGKIYQTTTSALPAGTYTFSPIIDWQGTLDPAYIVVAPSSDSIPDYSKIVGNTSIGYTLFSAAVPSVTFTLTAAAKVTVGFAVNYILDQQGFKLYNVKLYTYPKHL